MQKLNLLTYSNPKYRPSQSKLVEHAQSLFAFDNVITETRSHFALSHFYEENKEILDLERGNGYWLWKPWIMLDALRKMNDGDVLLYMDCGDWIEEGGGLREAVFKLMADKCVYLTDGAFKNSEWTKRDCFVMMGCDKEEYHNAIQVEAGIVVVKKTIKAIEILTEWLNWCKNKHIVTDLENVSGFGNYEGFKDHRHDQSILTNLRVKHSIPSGNAMRRFIHCNVNQVC